MTELAIYVEGGSEYHKTRHAFDILGKSDAALIRSKVSHCKRLFDVLAVQMDAAI